MEDKQREEKLREKFISELGVASWKGLLPDTLNKSLFIVSPDLDLVEVGVQVALDHSSEIKKWLETGQLARPSIDQMTGWDTSGSLFQFIIVEPFVFFQEYTVPQC